MSPTRAAAAVLALSLAACGGGSKSSDAAPSDWVDVPGMICGDGSPTGIAISRGRSDAVLVYLSPGGACWSADECDVSLKSFSPLTYEVARDRFVPGTVLDRALPGNPFSDWTIVVIPYCTGDVHVGDLLQHYGGAAGSWDHHGFRNLQAAVATFTGALPAPAQLVVAGSSAGGFGSLAAYELVRTEWPGPGTTAALLDDSGATFDPSGIPTALLSHWWSTWGLELTIGGICSECATDLSRIWANLHTGHDQDRLGLVSTTQDAIMIGFFADPSLGVPAMTGTEFETNVAALAAALDGMPNVATFRVGGDYRTEHALLVDRYFLAGAQGPALLDWVSAMISLDPGWASTLSR